MRILLTANASYVPPRGGATRSNLLWVEHMAAAGHECRIVSASLPDNAGKRAQIAGEKLDWQSLERRDGIEILRRGGVDVLAVCDRPRLAPLLHDQIRKFHPDWVLVSSEDLGHVLLREAQHSAPGRVIYIAHTPQFFPFGPASWNPDSHATELVARSAGVVAIGHYMADYIRQHTGKAVAVIHPPIYGKGPFPDLASFDSGLVAMVNPCAIKGISIFLALADRFSACEFGVLPGWGTTSADRAGISRRRNITLLPNFRDIADFLRRTRLLLMPSLWYEGFGLTVMEAMLHGIPVIASDAGGLVEAKMGTPFVVPVHGIQRYEPVFDEHSLPKPVIEPPDIEPWAGHLHTLLTDRAVYGQVSEASRTAALSFVNSLDAGALMRYLESLTPGEAVPERVSLASLSPEKKALLLRKMREKRAALEPR
ncbi:MAG: glycosyltransferase family 4 protein [Bryobacteraceae bacterium]